jgi:predicted transcriptional regulator
MRAYKLKDRLIRGIEEMARRNRRLKTTELEIAIEEYLRRNGIKPPKVKPAE